MLVLFQTDFEYDLSGLDIPVLRQSYLDETSLFDLLPSVDSSSDPGTPPPAQDPSVAALLSAFRDFISLIWMLYTRDMLSLALRTKLTLAEKKV